MGRRRQQGKAGGNQKSAHIESSTVLL